ncbi:MAG TPA: protein kinase, partial [Gemmatimonadales bacterium]|nr:protein kinase [Gemmatimonadales bacterium]
MADPLFHLTNTLSDRYRLERELGAGGMATVYLADDLKHDRQVAVKVLRPELAAVIGAERFLAEIRTTAALQHPHILPLFDSGAADGFLFYVMPFVAGETVRDRLTREKQLPITDAVRIAGEVAAALDYAHRRGVIHRDIKPENILLHDGSALVADFGIALAASKAGGTRMTETGMSLGTPHYMSPEQALGERDITARADVYAVGCVLYEMLLGEPPFTGPTAQSVVAKVLSDKPGRLTARRERIPPHVEDAVLTALEKLPADRFGTAAEFAAALAAPAGSRARRETAAPGGRRLDWRMTAVTGLLAGAAITALALGRTDPAAGGTFGAAGRRQLTFNGRSGGPAISPDGGYVAYVDRRCPRGLVNPCTASLLVQERDGGRPVAVLGDVPGLSTPRFAPDGLTLLVSAQLDSARAGLFVVPRLGGVPRRIAAPGVFDTHATADSAVVATADRGGGLSIARFIALPSGAEGDSIVLPEGRVDAIAWSPDGRLLALVERYARLTLVRRDGSIADSLRGPFRSNVRWTPDGSGVLLFRALPVKEDDLVEFTVNGDGRIVGTGQVQLPATQTLLQGEFDIARRTGQLVLATGSATWDLWTFDLGPDAGPARQRTSGTTWYGIPSISPDGARVFYLRGDAVGDNLYMLTLADGEEEALTAEPHPGAGGAKVSG